MKFIHLTGKTLAAIIGQDELYVEDLQSAGVETYSIVRINEQGDIEIRRPKQWDVIGGLLGDYQNRVKAKTGMEWA